ncbi:MAG: DUF2341 domain-containing protein, partial [Candidatus Lokiarchaeota archaeon]|nr:DUF2341 domain-containing protein [Candidatus Lokiarchaeota archaeon]
MPRKPNTRAIFGTIIAMLFILPLMPFTFTRNSESAGFSSADLSASINGFAYTKIVNISPATPAANYQIRVNLNVSFDYAACQADGDDVRFYDTTGAPLSFWTEKWMNGGNSTIWVLVPVAGTTSIKMAYGNATIGSGSNGVSTFPLFDDFSSGSINTTRWGIETDIYSTVTVSGGRALVQSLTPSPSGSFLRLGFSDQDCGHGVTNSLSSSKDVVSSVGDLVTYNGVTTTTTDLNEDQVWLLMDYRWISGTSVIFSENETVKATHTTNIPTTSIPVSFLARCNYFGPGTNYAAILRSNMLFATGYAFRTVTYIHHLNWGNAEPYAIIDWVLVRKTAAVE